MSEQAKVERIPVVNARFKVVGGQVAIRVFDYVAELAGRGIEVEPEDEGRVEIEIEVFSADEEGNLLRLALIGRTVLAWELSSRTCVGSDTVSVVGSSSFSGFQLQIFGIVELIVPKCERDKVWELVSAFEKLRYRRQP